MNPSTLNTFACKYLTTPCSSPFRKLSSTAHFMSVTGFALWVQSETSFCEQAPNGCFCQPPHGSLPTRICHQFWIATCAAVRLWWLLPLFTPFTPPNSTFDKRDSTRFPCFYAESAIKWFQWKAPQRLTIPYKSAKIYLHKGTADRRLVQIISCKNSR